MQALILNSTLERSPEPTTTEAPADVVSSELTRRGWSRREVIAALHGCLEGAARIATRGTTIRLQ
jgi:hypothetical protein